MTISQNEPQAREHVQKRSVAVIGVGAIQGIGAAVSRRFAHEGYLVYVVGRTSEKINAVVNDIRQQGGTAQAYVLDAENQQAVQVFFDQIEHEGSQLDAVIHNVGGNTPSIFLRTPLKFFNQMWQSTFLSAYLVTQASLVIFLKQQKGTLIFTGASASMRGKPFFCRIYYR